MMVFIYAFLICGVMCCISQFLIMKTKIGFIGLFALLMVIGAILGATGLIGPLMNLGLMGVIVTIMALCERFYGFSLDAMHGDAGGLIIFLVLLLCIVVFTTICGLVAKLPSSKKDQAE